MSIGAPVLVGVLGLVAAMAVVVSYGIWRHRPRTGATWLAISTFFVAVWSAGNAAVLASTDATTLVAAGHVTMLAPVVCSITWIHFSARYTGRDEWLTPRRSLLLWLAPGAVVVWALLTSEPLLSDEGRRIGSLVLAPSAAYFVIIGYGYFLESAGIALLFGKLRHSRNVYRRRTFFFVLIGVTMVLSHSAALVGLSPVTHQSLGPLSFLGIGILASLVLYDSTYLRLLPVERLFGLFGNRFEDLGPIARDAVIEEMGSGVVVLDAQNHIVDLNPIARRMLGTTDERIVGDTIDSVLDPEAFEDEQLTFLDPDVREGRFDGIWVQTPDDRRRCYDVVISGLGEQSNDVSGRVAIIHDVTEKQRQKQQLEAQTRKLTRQNENLDEFATIVSHDIRNPLTVATGNVEYAYETGDLDRLTTAMDAHDRIETIVSDVLRLARQGKSVDETEPVSIVDMATTAWETIDTDGATLVTSASASDTVDADPGRLRQIFENLFRNSVEHGSAGSRTQSDTAVEHDADSRDGAAAADGGPVDIDSGPGLRIRVGATEDGFYVEDNGPGIPAADREKVFVEGYTTDEGGTGLGLAIVSMVVDSHGWDIAVIESDSGGARFEVTTT